MSSQSGRLTSDNPEAESCKQSGSRLGNTPEESQIYILFSMLNTS